MSHNKLVVVTSYPIHSEPAIRNRLSSYFRELSNAGWQIHLVTPESGPEGRTEQTVPFGVAAVRYVEPSQYDRQHLVSRGLNEIRMAQRLLRVASRVRADAMLLTVPSLFLLLFVFQKKRRLNIVDVRDLVWEYLPDYPHWQRAVKYILGTFATFSLRKSDIITASNPKEVDYLEAKVSNSKILLVSNGIGKEQYEAISSIEPLPGNNDRLHITYIGNVGLAQNLTTIVRAIANYPQFELNIIGTGTDYKNVQAEIEKLKASNVYLHGRVPWNQVLKWYARSDVLYAQVSGSYSTAMPSKLYEYLATGLPIVYGGHGAGAEIVQEFENVEVIPPDSPKELRRVLVDMFQQGQVAPSRANIEKIGNEYIREDQVAVLVEEMARIRDTEV